MTMTQPTGGCFCGAIRYEVTAPAVMQFVCHCRACQYAAGGSPTVGWVVPKAALAITKGEPAVFWATGDSGAKVGRCFCGACGTPLFSKLEVNPDLMVVKIGGLDDPSAFQPGVELWMSEAQPWHRPHEGAARFEGNPGGA